MLKKIPLSKMDVYLVYVLMYAGYAKMISPLILPFFSVIQIVSLGLLYALMIYRIEYIKVKMSTVILSSIMFLAFIFMIISTVYNRTMSIAMSRISSMLSVVVFSIVIYISGNAIARREEEQTFLKIMAIGNLVITVLYLLFNGTKTLIEGIRFGDAGGGNSIWMARLICDALICIFLINNFNLKRNRFVLLWFLLVLVWTGSKGPIFSCAFVLFLCYMNQQNVRKKISILLLFSFVALAIGIIMLMVDANGIIFYLERLIRIDTITNSAIGYRVDRYMYTIKEIPNKFMIGNGLSSWAGMYWGRYGMTYNNTDYPHNSILEIIFETGLCTFVLVVISIIVFVKKTSKSKEYKIYYMLFFLNVLYSLFSGSILGGNKNLFNYFALCCGLMDGKRMNSVRNQKSSC